MRWLSILMVWAACGGDSPSGDSDGGVVEVPMIDRERSLVWIDSAIVDDPSLVGLSRVMSAVGADAHGGTHLRDWFVAFSTTAHSERLGPALLIEELVQTHGPDPTAWDLDALPFIVTAVHNRIDLGPRNGGCGELRVSFSSTHPIYAPFHLIFLFEQLPGGDDAACRALALRWAQLSELDGAELVAAARQILDDGLVAERFLLAESVELTVSPWEWRQWDGLTNPPLFQTVDTPRLNQPGALRDQFVSFATDNADALSARQIEIPAQFRAQSARVPPGVPRETLDLMVEGQPELAAQIEITGCPACHTEDAEFVQTTPQRTFSDFYDKELDARALWLADYAAGLEVATPPFGPLHSE